MSAPATTPLNDTIITTTSLHLPAVTHSHALPPLGPTAALSNVTVHPTPTASSSCVPTENLGSAGVEWTPDACRAPQLVITDTHEWWHHDPMPTVTWALAAYSIVSFVVLLTLLVNGSIDWKLDPNDDHIDERIRRHQRLDRTREGRMRQAQIEYLGAPIEPPENIRRLRAAQPVALHPRPRDSPVHTEEHRRRMEDLRQMEARIIHANVWDHGEPFTDHEYVRR